MGSVSAETFDILSQGEDSESCGGFSWCDLLKNPDDLPHCEPETRTVVSAVPDVTVVPVSPSSVVTELFEDVSLDSDWEFVDPQSLSLSKKRSSELEQGEMVYEGSPVRAPPNTRRRMMPPTPQQILLLQWMKAGGKRSWKRKASGKKGNGGNGILPGNKRRSKSGD